MNPERPSGDSNKAELHTPPAIEAVDRESEGPSHVDRLASLLREGLEGLPVGFPGFQLKMFFSWHGSEADIGEYAEQVEDADCVVMEVFGWKQEVNDERNEVINDARSVRAERIIEHAREQNPHEAAILEVLRGSRKKLVVDDVPAGHPLIRELDEVRERLKDLHQAYPSISFDEHIEKYRQIVEAEANVQMKREEYMMTQFAPLLAAAFPHSKEQIKVLWGIGSSHTSLFLAFQKVIPEKASRVFSQNGTVTYDYFAQAVREEVNGGEVSTATIQKSWMQDQIDEYLEEPGVVTLDRSDQMGLYSRYLVDALEPRLINDIYSRWQTGASRKDLIRESLASVGVNFPPSGPKEILSFIGQSTAKLG